jgi:hypothetical protein
VQVTSEHSVNDIYVQLIDYLLKPIDEHTQAAKDEEDSNRLGVSVPLCRTIHALTRIAGEDCNSCQFVLQHPFVCPAE